MSFSIGAKGEVGYALLDPPPQARSSVDLSVALVGRSKRGSGGNNPTRASSRPANPAKFQVRCLFAKADSVIVALCHEALDEVSSGQACALEILKLFIKEYHTKLEELRGIFDDLGADKKVHESPMSEEDVWDTFQEFDAILEGLPSVKPLLRPRERKSLEEKSVTEKQVEEKKMRFSADMALGNKVMHTSGEFPNGKPAQKEEGSPIKEKKKESKEEERKGDKEERKGDKEERKKSPKEEKKKRGTPKEKKKSKTISGSPRTKRDDEDKPKEKKEKKRKEGSSKRGK